MIFDLTLMNEHDISILFGILKFNTGGKNCPVRSMKINIEKIYSEKRISDVEYMMLISILKFNLDKAEFIDRANQIFN